MQSSQKLELDMMGGLLEGRYGLPIKGYWQTVTVCQLEIIGRPFTKFVNVMPQSFEQCSNSCYIIQSNRGLSTRRFWHNVYKFCERSANNLLLADRNSLPITFNWQTITAFQ